MPTLRETLDEQIDAYRQGSNSWWRDQDAFKQREVHVDTLAKGLAAIDGLLEDNLNDVKVAVATLAANTATMISTGLTRFLQSMYSAIDEVEKRHALVVRDSEPEPCLRGLDSPLASGSADTGSGLSLLSSTVADKPERSVLAFDKDLLTPDGLERFIALDYYQRLSLGSTATEAQIKQHYRALSLLYHPDRNLEKKTEASAVFVAVCEAYETLSDAGKRYAYDSDDMTAGEQERVRRQQRRYQSYRPNSSILGAAAVALSFVAVRSGSRGGTTAALVTAAVAAGGLALWSARSQRAVRAPVGADRNATSYSDSYSYKH